MANDADTPRGAVLLPLGIVALLGGIAALAFLDTGFVSTILAMFIVLAGCGMIWQAYKNIQDGRW